MMKNLTLMCLFAILFLAGGCKKTEDVQVSMNWLIDANIHSTGEFENSLEIKNEGNSALGGEWTIYFCQFPINFQFAEDSPITIERITGTYFKMYPTAYYKPVGKGETLQVKWHTKRKYPHISFTPDAAYIVAKKEGVELTPRDVPVTVVRNDNEFRSLSATGEKIYYPFGDIVYDENAAYLTGTSLSETDIIPSVKSVKKNAGAERLVFPETIQISYDSSYANEAKLLEQALSRQLGYKIAGQATVSIHLAKGEKGNKFVNDEHYLLAVTKEGVTITGNTPHAIFNGTQTLLALLSGQEQPASLTPCEISDYPDFAYRGVMLDVARNFTKKEDVLKVLDLMAAYKMSVFHFHIADDEGWRVEIPGLEELTQVGSRRGHTTDEKEFLYPAYVGHWNPDDATSSANGYYTRQDFIDILEYANQRHITVIPEVELPGHARAAIVAMKARYRKYKDSDLAKAEEYMLVNDRDTSKYLSVQGYSDNVINVALPSTYRFVDKVISELARMYNDAGLELKIMHIGGDEVAKAAWTGAPECIELMESQGMQQPRELKDYFVEEVLKLTREKGITVAGWQEITLKPHENVVDDRFAHEKVISYIWNTVPNWGGDEVAYKLANAGFQVVLSNVSNFYLDMAYSSNFYEPGHNWGGYVDEISTFDMQPFNIYSSVRRDIAGKRMDVPAGTNKEKLKPGARKEILGVQGQLFAETIRNFDMVLSYLFPKILGLAERGWDAEPEWSKTGREQDYIEAVSLYNTKVSRKELPRLHSLHTHFHLAEPGLKIIDNRLHANSRVSGAEIRYTTDGSEPTRNSTEWVEPVECEASIIKAKTFYLDKESVTVILFNDKAEQVAN